MNSRHICGRILSIFFVLTIPTYGQVPQLINYQGRLLDGTNLVNGSVGLSLQFYTNAAPVGGEALVYADSNNVTVTDGLYSTFIGDDTTAGSLVNALNRTNIFLQVVVNGTALTPRERLGAVAYSLATRGLLVDTNSNIVANPNQNTIAPGSTGHSSILGGHFNSIGTQSFEAFIGGGSINVIHSNSPLATIAGGHNNVIGHNSAAATISGGGSDEGNSIGDNSPESVVAGGEHNLIGPFSPTSTIGGGHYNEIGTNSFAAVIAGGAESTIGNNSDGAVIGGGTGGSAIRDNSPNSIIAGGNVNIIEKSSKESTIGGGHLNFVGTNSASATIAGGNENEIGDNSSAASIGGGRDNVISRNAIGSVIAGGDDNVIKSNSFYSNIGGGDFNAIGSFAPRSVIPGGSENGVGVGATNAFAAGHRAHADHPGTFVWADNQDADFVSSAANQFLIRATGGVGIGTPSPEGELHVLRGSAGAVSASSAAALVVESDASEFIQLLTPAGTLSGILFGSPLNASDASIRYNNSGGNRELTFRTGDNSQKMVITSNGFVGVGTTAPVETLHVAGNALMEGFPMLGNSTLSPISGDTLIPTSAYVFVSNVTGTNVGLSGSSAIIDGSRIGQLLILQGMGTAVIVSNNANVRLASIALSLGSNDVLTLIWNGQDWIEVSFSNN